MSIVPAPMPEDVSPIEAHRERLYWMSLLAGKSNLKPELRVRLFELEQARRLRELRAEAGRNELPLTPANRAA